MILIQFNLKIVRDGWHFYPLLRQKRLKRQATKMEKLMVSATAPHQDNFFHDNLGKFSAALGTKLELEHGVSLFHRFQWFFNAELICRYLEDYNGNAGECGNWFSCLG